jgi:hypothetical protein
MALALTALTTTPASALTKGAVVLKVCKKVPSGLKGLWETTEECKGTKYAENGKFAWAWPSKAGETTYCVLGGKTFTESLCETSGSGPFLEVTTKEAFPKLEGALLLSLLKSSVAGLKTTIDCTTGTFAGQPLTVTLLSGGIIKYEGCTISALAKCEIQSVGGTPGNITTKALDSVLNSETLINFSPEAESKFVELEIVGSSCAEKSTKLPIKGEQMCAIGGPVSPSTPALLHLIECAASGSNLKLGEEKATYEGVTHVKVEGNQWWKIN